MSEPLRVLQITGTMGLGGAETMVMNIYRNIDRDKIQFDFFLVDAGVEYYEPEIKKLGGLIYRTKKRSDNLIKYSLDLYKLLKNNKYSIVHVHASSAISGFLPIWIAKLAGVKKRFFHSHNTKCNHIWLHKLLRPYINAAATHRYACGELASEWMYGKKSKDAVVLGIPVDCAKFKFDLNNREQKRIEWGAKSDFVYGHIGRFNDQKNHEFLIEVFNEIVQIDPNVKLILMGDGPLMEKIKDKAKTYGIIDKVIFLGLVNDVNESIDGLDSIIFPSLYEGFPTVLLEAQANGLPCYVSDTITDKIKITDLICSIPLNKTSKEWATIIVNSRNINCKNRLMYNNIIKENYDVSKITEEIAKAYLA